jgi:hypothetical protein
MDIECFLALAELEGQRLQELDELRYEVHRLQGLLDRLDRLPSESAPVDVRTECAPVLHLLPHLSHLSEGRKRGPRRCSVCSQSGHDLRTCGQVQTG